MGMVVLDATRPPYDTLLDQLADYVLAPLTPSNEATETATWVLFDSLGCALEALNYPECCKLLGPLVPGLHQTGGCKVPGTPYELDPVQGAFNIGTLIRWLDFNDTWLAAEWGHPSDNLGTILAIADWQGRQTNEWHRAWTIADLLTWIMKAHEIQGVLALNHSFNRVGLDHVLLVRIASTAVAAAMLGATKEQVRDALSHAWIDGGALRTYRHAPNTGSRKSWAAGDACRRAVMLALTVLRGEMGYPSALTAKTWGFQDVLFKSQPIALSRPLGTYVIENVLFKIRFPAEFHAQTAVECAIALHPKVVNRLNDIASIAIDTHESAIRIINKTGPLANPADRDHCLQYMAAIGLIFGDLRAEHYEHGVAQDPRIDMLRSKMVLTENPQYSKDYLDPEKRSIANAMSITFTDGTSTEQVAIEYPIGHRRRRQEARSYLQEKLNRQFRLKLPESRAKTVLELMVSAKLSGMPVTKLMDMFQLA